MQRFPLAILCLAVIGASSFRIEKLLELRYEIEDSQAGSVRSIVDFQAKTQRHGISRFLFFDGRTFSLTVKKSRRGES